MRFCFLLAVIWAAAMSLDSFAKEASDAGADCKMVPTEPTVAPGMRERHPPKFPSDTREAGGHCREGTVVVRVTVDSTGYAHSLLIRSSSGCRSLDQAAVAVVKTWQFVPATSCGQKVEGHVDVPVSFHFSKDK
jgi:protein TonB